MADPKPSGLFSSLSLGRTAKSPRSSETLAHPLLGASTSSLNLSTDPDPSALGTSPTNPTLSPKASSTFSRIQTESLPYKPRQRHSHRNSSGSAAGIISPNMIPSVTAPTAPPTTSTSSTFALPPSAEGMLGEPAVAGPSSASATSRLQVQSLKASAQRLGLANGSMGMAMVDAVVDKGQVAKSGSKHGEGGDWGDIMRVLTSGKAVMLLPSPSSSSSPMTPQVMREHLAFISPPIYLNPLLPSQMRSSDSLAEKGREAIGETVSMVVTLSGLIGTLKGTTISFQSILEPDSPLLTALRDTTARPGVLASLRPTILPLPSAFPSYTLSTQSASLAFPPLGKPISGISDATEAAKEVAKASAAKLGRMNPFASFFGSSSSTPAASATSSTRTGGTAPDENGQLMVSRFDLSPNSGSPNPSLLSADNADASSVLSEPIPKDAEGFSIQAYTISKPIRSSEVHKALSKAIRSHIKESLSRLPETVLDRTTKLVLASICPAAGSGDNARLQATDDESVPVIKFGQPTVASEQLQVFMESVYDDLVVHYRNDSSLFVAEAGLKRKGSGGKPWGRSSETAEEDVSKETKDKRRRDREERAEKMGTEGTERVEALITRLLYNRLFSPLESDDARHDEALASRIAALNMLDLSLDHLGLITQPDDEEVPGTIAAGLSSIVDEIGDELQKLITPTCLVPRAKAEVLIKAHKLVVDGLSDLTPVQLRPEGEQYKASPAISQSESLDHPPVATEDDDHAGRRSSDAPPLSPSKLSAQATQLSDLSSDGSPPETIDHLKDDHSESMQLEEAMGDSVMTLHASPSSSSPPTRIQEQDATPRAKPPKQSTSGADLILPIIIFAVVKANPPQLASQLMYLRRYRSAICLTGEASYAMVNLTAVVEFLEHVDLAELGLGGESDKVMSVADLSPIGLDYLDESNVDAQSIASASSRLRGRVFQVGELAGTAAGSANKVITGVIDSSWSAVRGLISTAGPATEEADTTPAGSSRPTLRARQPSGFSLANVTASVASIAAAAAATTAAARSRAGSRAADLPQSQQWQGNQEMVDVTSRPQSIREVEGEYPSDSESESSEYEKSKDPFVGSSQPQLRGLSDARSIRSVSSMMSREGRKEDAGRMAERVSLSDRLANIGGFGKTVPGPQETSPGPSPEKDRPTVKPVGFLASLTGSRSASSTGLGHGRRGSLLSGAPESVGRARANSGSTPNPTGSPSRTPSILSREEPVPRLNERFLTCDLGDIQLSELGELLREYRRLAEYIGNTQGK